MAFQRALTLDRDPELTIPHLLYDLSIDNLQERQNNVQRFTSAKQVANHIGVVPKTVFENRLPGTRIWSSKHEKHFAVRVEKS